MTCELLGPIPWSLHRLLDCSMSQAHGMNMIWDGRAVPFCRVWSKLCWCTWGFLTVGQLGCLTVSGSQRALGIWVALYFLTGSAYLVGCCLARDYLLSPVGYVTEVILWPESQKLGISIPLSSPVIVGESSLGAGAVCQDICCAPGRGPPRWSLIPGDFWDL